MWQTCSPLCWCVHLLLLSPTNWPSRVTAFRCPCLPFPTSLSLAIPCIAIKTSTPQSFSEVYLSASFEESSLGSGDSWIRKNPTLISSRFPLYNKPWSLRVYGIPTSCQGCANQVGYTLGQHSEAVPRIEMWIFSSISALALLLWAAISSTKSG